MQKPDGTTLSSIPSSADRLRTLRIAHPRITQVMDELDTLIFPDSNTSILLVCGPTGAGKTVLARNMVGKALHSAKDQMESCAGIVPAVYVEAPSSGENDFSWRLSYQRILGELGDALDAPKVAYGIDPESGRWQQYMQRKGEQSMENARAVIENACEQILADGKAINLRELSGRVPGEVLGSVRGVIGLLQEIKEGSRAY